MLAKSIAELIALVKACAGELTLAPYGERFKSRAGVEMVHVPRDAEVCGPDFRQMKNLNGDPVLPYLEVAAMVDPEAELDELISHFVS